MDRRTRRYFKPGEAHAFLRQRVSHGGAACLPWPYFVSAFTGYGTLGFEGKVYYAHRLMCELANGPAPSDEHEAAHSCGYRSCVNPHHLSWKTGTGNQFDRRLHGTDIHPGKKLNPQQHREILALKGKMKLKEIADRYGVSVQSVSAMMRKDRNR